MVAEECLFLANYKQGCKLVSYELNGKPLLFERKVVDSHKGFSLTAYHRLCMSTSKHVLAGDIASAAGELQNLLAQFRFVIVRDKAVAVLNKVKRVQYSE